MKYIDFESWTVTWLHEGNVIVEDQLTHNFNPRPAGTPDFPPPAGGGGAFERPLPHDLGSWSP